MAVPAVATEDVVAQSNYAKDELLFLQGTWRSQIHNIINDLPEKQEDEIYKQIIEPFQEAIEEALDTMRTWYNGYRFAQGQAELLYNPTNALYFLKHLYLYGEPPERLAPDERQLLRACVGAMREEQRDRPHYEGRHGPSAREIRGVR